MGSRGVCPDCRRPGERGPADDTDSALPLVTRLRVARAISPDAPWGRRHRIEQVECLVLGEAARVKPMPSRGRSLRPSWPSLARRKPRFAILSALGFLRRSTGMGLPLAESSADREGPRLGVYHRGLRFRGETGSRGWKPKEPGDFAELTRKRGRRSAKYPSDGGFHPRRSTRSSGGADAASNMPGAAWPDGSNTGLLPAGRPRSRRRRRRPAACSPGRGRRPRRPRCGSRPRPSPGGGRRPRRA